MPDYSEDNGSGYRQDRLNRELEAETIAEAAQDAAAEPGADRTEALRASPSRPKQMAGGVVVIEPPKGGGEVDLTITFNGQKHRFAFAATPTA